MGILEALRAAQEERGMPWRGWRPVRKMAHARWALMLLVIFTSVPTWPAGAPSVEAVATSGLGVFATLQTIGQLLLDRLSFYYVD